MYLTHIRRILILEQTGILDISMARDSQGRIMEVSNSVTKDLMLESIFQTN
jgi:hypothetical protein